MIQRDFIRHTATLAIIMLCSGCYRSAGGHRDTGTDTGRRQTDTVSADTIPDPGTDSQIPTDLDTSTGGDQATDGVSTESEWPSDTEWHTDTNDDAACFAGDYVIATQKDVDGLLTYPCITGALNIHGDTLETVTLPNLQRIGGSLEVSKTGTLVSFSLPRLTEIGNDLVIGCQTESDVFDYPCSNLALTDIRGLDSLSVVGGNVRFIGNAALLSFEGPAHIGTVEGDVIISNNSAVRYVSGFDNLTHVSGDLVIIFNTLLSDVTAFSKLISIGGTLHVEGNSSLGTLSGLQNVVTVGNDLLMGQGSQLESLPLSSLTSVGGDFVLHGHYRLSDMSEFSSLTAIGGNVTVSFLGVLPDLRFLSRISQIHGNLELSSLTLKDLSGLENLVSIGGSLAIFENGYALETLDGLNNLKSIGGGITMYYNYTLNTLTHLESLTSVGKLADGEDIRIVSNRLLPNCDICSLVHQLSAPPEADETWIEKNGADTCGSETMTITDLTCP